jgi:hypothetical protein
MGVGGGGGGAARIRTLNNSVKETAEPNIKSHTLSFSYLATTWYSKDFACILVAPLLRAARKVASGTGAAPRPGQNRDKERKGSFLHNRRYGLPAWTIINYFHQKIITHRFGKI